MKFAPSRRAIALCAGVATAATLAVAPPATAAPGAQPSWDRSAPTDQSAFTADPLPTVQVDGIVWSVTARGGKAYAGGAFANARPAGAAPGTQQTSRPNILAFDLATGELDPAFRADVNGTVRDVEVTQDGTKLLVAGDFTQINGHTRVGFAVLDAATGEVLAPHLQLNAAAHAVATHGNIAYLGGAFTSVRGQARGGVAAVDLTTGAVLPFNAWVAGGSVYAMEVSPDGRTVVIGGQFTSLPSQAEGGIALLDAATGAVRPAPIADVLRTGGRTSGVYGLSADESGFYVGGWKWNVLRGFEGVAAADWNGNLRWMADCHGDTVDVWSSGDEVHAVGHPHTCATVGGFPEFQPQRFDGMMSFSNSVRGVTTSTPDPRSYLDFGGLPAPRLTSHNPRIDAGAVRGQSTHAVDGEGDYMVVGGEFPSVQGVAQQGLVRFARRGVAPDSQRPEYSTLGLRAVTAGPGRVQLLVTPTWDRDDTTLTYRVSRGGTVIDERRVASSNWARADYAIIDEPPAGTSVYSVEVLDPAGNSQLTQTTLVGTGGAQTPYAATVSAAGADEVWTSGTGTAAGGDRMPGLSPTGTLVLGGGARKVGGLLGDAIHYGAPGATATSQNRSDARFDVSVETWVRATPNSRPGRLLGFGAKQTGTNDTNDRLLYLDANGRVRFGTWTPKMPRTVVSPAPITDGKWHHVVGTVDAVGMHRLYVDGVEVDSVEVAVGATNQPGYWRGGADSMAVWEGVPGAQAADATIDSPAVYHRALTGQEVAEHRLTGAQQATTSRPLQDVGGAGQVWFTNSLGGGLTGGTLLPGMASDELLVGDWDGDGIDDIGYREGSTFHLLNRVSGQETTFAYGRPGDDVYVGDWDGDGDDTIAVRRGNQFFVRNSFTDGWADEVLTFGRVDDEVIVGDWDGNGSETLGVRRGNAYYILNDFSGGWADEEMTFGRVQDAAHAGDWDGDGADSIALRRGNVVYAADDFRGGNAPTEFVFGRADDVVYIGDWTGTGVDGMALGRGSTYYVANRLRSGVADRTFGFPTPLPGQGEVLVGRWGGDTAESLAVFHRAR